MTDFYLEKFTGEKAMPSCRLMQQHFYSHEAKHRDIFEGREKGCFFGLLKVSHETISTGRVKFLCKFCFVASALFSFSYTDSCLLSYVEDKTC